MPTPVPQFIKEEIKLMGLINFTQLSIIVGFFGLFGLLWVTVQKWLCLTITLILAPFVFAIAFGKIHEVPIYKLVGSMIKYIWLPKQYIFKKETYYSLSRTSLTKKSTTPVQTPLPSYKKQIDPQTLKKLTDLLDK